MNRLAHLVMAAGLRCTLPALVLAEVMVPAGLQAQARRDMGRTIRDSVYTVEQAERGGRLVQVNCLMCHTTGQWSSGHYIRNWAERPLQALFDNLRDTMPYDDPGRLTRDEYAAVVAYLLRLNGVPAGDVPLPAEDGQLRQIRVTIPEHRPSALR